LLGELSMYAMYHFAVGRWQKGGIRAASKNIDTELDITIDVK
jgi:hypothetical protein